MIATMVGVVCATGKNEKDKTIVWEQSAPLIVQNSQTAQTNKPGIPCTLQSIMDAEYYVLMKSAPTMQIVGALDHNVSQTPAGVIAIDAYLPAGVHNLTVDSAGVGVVSSPTNPAVVTDVTTVSETLVAQFGQNMARTYPPFCANMTTCPPPIKTDCPFFNPQSSPVIFSGLAGMAPAGAIASMPLVFNPNQGSVTLAIAVVPGQTTTCNSQIDAWPSLVKLVAMGTNADLTAQCTSQGADSCNSLYNCVVQAADIPAGVAAYITHVFPPGFAKNLLLQYTVSATLKT